MKELAATPYLLTFNIFAQRTDVVAFVTSRIGGFSNHPVSSCNIGLTELEDIATTIKNRQQVCQALGISFETLTFQNQVHSDSIAIVDAHNAGAGRRVKAEAIEKTDALITSTKGVTLIAQSADCVPIVIYDTQKKVAAAVHAGWRGTVKKIAQKTALRMVEAMGCNPANMIVGIGPSIGPCCYEVGKEVLDETSKAFGNSQSLVSEVNSKQHFNLWEANRLQLIEVGIANENIELSRICTFCNHRTFYSHRHDRGVTGRFGAGISIL